MKILSKKGLRKIDFALNRFYTPKSLFSPKTIKDLQINDFLSRQLQLTDHRVRFMTDIGISHLRAIVSTIVEEDIFNRLADYSDIWAACRTVLEELLSADLRLEGGTEFINLVQTKLSSKIDIRTFVVPIVGVELKGFSFLELGAFKIVPANASFLDSLNVNHEHADVDKVIEMTKAEFWLVGSVSGTDSVAEGKFQMQAELTVGMLAVFAASMFKNGATSFRIGVVMSSQQAYGKAIWLSWAAEKQSLTTHYGSSGSQNLEINDDLLEEFNEDGMLNRVFKMFQAESKTELEEAICRAIYWYSDAHREKVPVMKLVKYWSCIETFFSTDNKDITRSVSVGLASVLTLGIFRFIPFSEYTATKKRIVKLYGLRSKAVHGALHAHVSNRDAADLSQWIAWMLLNMIAFTDLGYTRVEEIKANTERLDSMATLPNGSLGASDTKL